jgi:hypothetical protein
LFIYLSLTSYAAATGIAGDYRIINIFQQETFKRDYNYFYTPSELQDIAKTNFRSNPPELNSFNDPNIQNHIRISALIIIDKLLNLSANAQSSFQKDRIEPLKQLRYIYSSEESLSKRGLPRYYHTTPFQQKGFIGIVESMKIKATSAQYYGAWLGTQFWTWNYTIFAFGTELEVPSSEVSKQSHTINSPSLSPFYFYGLGRLHDIGLWKNNTDLIAWSVPNVLEDEAKAIIEGFPDDQRNFLMSRMSPYNQTVLERQIISLAEIYTENRANSLFWMNLLLNTSAFNTRPINTPINGTLGEFLYCALVTSEEFPYYLVLNDGTNPALLTLNMGSRQTVTLRALKYPKVCVHLNAFVPDISIKDANDFLVLIADGKIVFNTRPNYVNFERSAREILKTSELDVARKLLEDDPKKIKPKQNLLKTRANVK